MKTKLIILFSLVAFAFALPFIGNKSIKVDNPSKLDRDGNFILYDFQPTRRLGTGEERDCILEPLLICFAPLCAGFATTIVTAIAKITSNLFICFP